MSDGFAGRYEVLEARGSGRRTWPPEVKLRIVAESHAAGTMVSEVARRHRLMPSQVTTWRRLHREGKLGERSSAASPAFVPLSALSAGIRSGHRHRNGSRLRPVAAW